MICAGCSCDGELHNLQAADPHDQEKRAGTSKLDIGKQMRRDIDGTNRRERGRSEEREIKGMKRWTNSSFRPRFMWKASTLGRSLRSASLASHVHKWLNCSGMSITTSVSWKAALWAKEDDVRSFLFTPLLQRAVGIHLYDGLWWPAAQSNLIPCFLSPQGPPTLTWLLKWTLRAMCPLPQHSC